MTADVLIGPNSTEFGSKLPATNHHKRARFRALFFVYKKTPFSIIVLAQGWPD